jgi:hypothetical protein
MYVFDAALNLLATKRIKIKKGDYSFNMSKTVLTQMLTFISLS